MQAGAFWIFEKALFVPGIYEFKIFMVNWLHQSSLIFTGTAKSL